MKNLSSIHLVAGPGVCRQRRGTLDVVYGVDAPMSAMRFERVQKMLLRGEIDIPEPAARLAAYLVAFDAVVTRGSLEGALRSCHEVYRWHDAVCVEWTNPYGRIDRRHVSAWTQFALGHPEALAIGPVVAIERLDQYLKRSTSDIENSYDLDRLISDGQAWSAFSLPGPWFSHVIGAAPLAALPRSALARESSGMSLCMSSVDVDAASQPMADACVGRALNAYLDPEAMDGSYWLVDKLIDDCPANATRREMVTNLLSTAASDSKGPISSLILAWATDLAESGTAGEPDVSPRTVSKYVRAIAHDLLDTFRGKALSQLASGDFDRVYDEIVASKSKGVQRTCASALSSWHYFLECWLEVAPRTRSLYRDLPEPIPKANVLWPHETQRILDWLEQADDHSRLNAQTRVAFALATDVRIRANELLKLRVKNVRLIDSIVELEICTMTSDEGLKSSNARRVQRVNCPKVASVLSAWRARRQQELAMPDDYLFGDPHRSGKSYRLGQMHVLLNRLIKDATGDATASLHTLSHSWATQNIFKAANSRAKQDINVFDAISENAAHGDASTTFANYVHRFEEAIRRCIDEALVRRIRWPEMAQFVGIGHDALRQRISRHQRSGSRAENDSFKLSLIQAAAPTLLVPSTDNGIDLNEGKRCVLLDQATAPSLGVVIDVLTDIASGIPSQITALRACRSAEDIVRISTMARRVFSEIGEMRPSRDVSGMFDPVDDVRIVLEAKAHGRINFERITQKKLLKLRIFLDCVQRDPSTDEALASWIKCYHRGYISLKHPSRASGIVKLLSMAGISSAEIGIFHTSLSRHSACSLIEQIDALFAQTYAIPPITMTCQERSGRPDAYLSIAGVNITSSASSATFCMTGFNALLLAANVHRQMVTNGQPCSEKTYGR